MTSATLPPLRVAPELREAAESVLQEGKGPPARCSRSTATQRACAASRSALLQFASICEYFGLHGAGVEAELQGFARGFAFGKALDRSLLGTLNERKLAAWIQFERGGQSLVESAVREWEGLFRHPALGPDARHGMDYHRPLSLL